MTPVELLGLICIFAVVRLAISLRPVPATTTGTSAEADAGEARPSSLLVVREYLDAFIVAGLVALFLITFVVRTFYIPSGSMEPTLQIHDVLLVNEFEYRFEQPHDGDIVVFPPPIPTTNDFIKRLIAGPGETLRVHHGIVYRNGKALVEPYIAEKPLYEMQIRELPDLRRRRGARPGGGQRPAAPGLDGARSHPGRLLLHDGRQSQQLGGFAHLGLRATPRQVRERSRAG